MGTNACKRPSQPPYNSRSTGKSTLSATHALSTETERHRRPLLPLERRPSDNAGNRDSIPTRRLPVQRPESPREHAQLPLYIEAPRPPQPSRPREEREDGQRGVLIIEL